MTTFDLETALKEEITGLAEIHAGLKRRASVLEQRYGEIEIEYNAVRKLIGFALATLEQKRDSLNLLIKAKTYD